MLVAVTGGYVSAHVAAGVVDRTVNLGAVACALVEHIVVSTGLAILNRSRSACAQLQLGQQLIVVTTVSATTTTAAVIATARLGSNSHECGKSEDQRFKSHYRFHGDSPCIISELSVGTF